MRLLPQYSQATGQDRHSVLVDYDIFMNVRRLDAQDITTLQKLYKAEDFDFRLKPGSAAVDRGTVLPNVTDGFSGSRRISGHSKSARLFRIMVPGRRALTYLTNQVLNSNQPSPIADLRTSFCNIFINSPQV